MLVVFADSMRITALILYVVVIVLTVHIAIAYYGRWVAERNRGWLGLLPRHVYLMALSLIAYATTAIVWSFDYWNQSVTPFTPINLIAGTSGIAALRILQAHERTAYPERRKDEP